MITSRQNSLIKEIRSLKDKKNRDNLSLYIAEGVKLTLECLSLNLPVRVIVGVERALKKIQAKIPSSIRVERVSEDVFSCISEEVTPQGVLAVIEKPEHELSSPKSSCILLDGVSDPTNVGAIIRTAIASGYSEIYLTETSADAYSPKSVRSSMGGVFRAKIYRCETDKLLSKINLPLIVGDMNGEDVFNFSINENFCLCLGNEGHGLSELVTKSAKNTVKIPMQNGMESLNVAVSAGILMYALKKKK